MTVDKLLIQETETGALSRPLKKNQAMGTMSKAQAIPPNEPSIFDNIRISVVQSIFIPEDFKKRFHISIDEKRGKIVLGRKKGVQRKGS